MKTLDVSIDGELQVSYVRLSQGEIVETIAISPAINVDCDQMRKPVGIEFLSDVDEGDLEIGLRLLNVPDDEIDAAKLGLKTFREFLLKN